LYVAYTASFIGSKYTVPDVPKVNRFRHQHNCRMFATCRSFQLDWYVNTHTPECKIRNNQESFPRSWLILFIHVLANNSMLFNYPELQIALCGALSTNNDCFLAQINTEINPKYTYKYLFIFSEGTYHVSILKTNM
jgi:hypothetical protein